MTNRRIKMFEYRQIIHRMREGESNRALARSGLIGRIKAKMIRYIATINDWLNPAVSLPNEEEIANTIIATDHATKKIIKLDPYKQQIDDWIQQGITARVIHQHLVQQYKFAGSYNCIQRYARKINNDPLNDLTISLSFAIAEAAQVDFGQGPKIFDPTCNKLVKSWIFVMTLCFSRHQYVEIIKHQDSITWLGCHRRAFEWFGGVPKKIIIDNTKCAITKACYYDPEIQRAYMEQAEDYGFIISPCPPYDPAKKGIVESGVKYVKKNFLPLRKFRDFTDSNIQAKQWVLGEAGNRTHGTTRQKPLTQFIEIEKQLLKPLPAVAPELCVWKKVHAHRDCHIRFEYSKYSAPYRLAKQELWLKATENTIKIYQDYIMVAMHCRSQQPGSTTTIFQHLPPNAQNFLIQDAAWCIEQAKTIGHHCEQFVGVLLNNTVCDTLRAAQAVIKLQTTFGTSRLEAACKRAIGFGASGYKVIKEILSSGLDAEIVIHQDPFDKLEAAYSGAGKFCRNSKELIIH